MNYSNEACTPTLTRGRTRPRLRKSADQWSEFAGWASGLGFGLGIAAAAIWALVDELRAESAALKRASERTERVLDDYDRAGRDLVRTRSELSDALNKNNDLSAALQAHQTTKENAQ